MDRITPMPDYPPTNGNPVSDLEARLSASEHECLAARAMVENSADIIALVDVDGRLREANPAASTILGWSPADFIGESMLTLVHPDDVARVRLALDQAAVSREPQPEITYRVLSRDDRWVTLASTSTNQLDNPAIGAIVVNARDVTERAGELQALITTLVTATEYRDPYTAGHQRSVASYSGLICTALGLPYYETERITMGAQLHDIGKIAIPAEILTKPGRLTPAEWALMKEHPQTGYDILSEANMTQPITDIVLHHHERLDGSGYPHGLLGGEMRIGARIVAVADTIDAICSHRPYRPARGVGVAENVLREGSGRLFDPEVVDAALDIAIPAADLKTA